MVLKQGKIRAFQVTFAILVGLLAPPRPPCAVAQSPTPGPKVPTTDLFGDPLPTGAIARLGSVRFRHGDQVYALALAPDGKTLASGGGDSTVRLWDVSTGKELRRFAGHKRMVRAVAFSPDGKHLASGSYDETVRLWEVETGKELRCLKGHTNVLTAVVFSPNGQWLASAGHDGVVRLWNWKTGQLQRSLEVAGWGAGSVVFSPDGKILAAGSLDWGPPRSTPDQKIRLWEIATGKELRTLKARANYALAFTPDGTMLASGSGHVVILWDAATGKEIHQLKAGTGQVTSLAFTRDGKTLAAGRGYGDQGIDFWRITDRTHLGQLARAKGTLAVAFAPDGKTLYSATGLIRVWDVATAKEKLSPQGHQGWLRSITFARDGKTVATAGEDGVRLWESNSGKELRRLPGLDRYAWSVQFSLDGKSLVGGGFESKACLWETDSGKKKRELVGEMTAFSPDGNVLAASQRGMIHLWNMVNGQEIRQFGNHRNSILSLLYSPDGRILASVTDGGRLRLWDPLDGKELRQLGENVSGVKGLSFSPDGRTLATSLENGKLRLWEVATGKERFLLGNHIGWAWTVAYSPDGRLLASGGDDGFVRVWEAATGKEVRQFQGHSGTVWSVAFAPHGKVLASASNDTTALLWDVAGLVPPPPKVQRKPTELDDLWTQLADADASQAYRAIQRLIATQDQAVLFLQKRLAPKATMDAKQLTQFVHDLNHPKFALRQQAERVLSKLGELAEPTLRTELQEKISLESKRRLEALLRKVTESRLNPTGEQIRELRVVEVLEGVGNPEARKILKRLAEGAPAARLTREARAALDRLLQ